MRQIEDRWRPNIRDPPNTIEMYNNIVKKYELNAAQQTDIRNYSLNALKKYVTGKCVNVCLNSANVDYKTCMQNCSVKLLQSDVILVDEYNKFQQRSKTLGEKVFIN